MPNPRMAPGLAGYLAGQQANQQADASELQMATGVTGLQALLEKRKQEQSLQQALANSGGDVEKAVELAIKSGNYAAAHQLAPLAKLAQEKRSSEDAARDLAVLNRPSATTRPALVDPQELQQAADQGTTAPPATMPASPEEARQRRIDQLKAIASLPRNASNAIVQQRYQAEIDKLEKSANPMIEHNYSVGGDRVQPHLSFDQGRTWQPIPGSQPSSKFAKQVAGVAEAPVIPPQHADKHGDDFLQTLAPGDREIVKGVAEYRINPATLSNRGGHRERILSMAAQVNPEYDQMQYGSRSAVRKDFTSGVAARNVTAINTALGHIGTMSELSEAMKNNDVQVANRVINAVKTQFGDPAINNYETAAQAVGEELMRVFRQVGASSHEAAAWESRFKAASTPAQLNGVIKTAAELLQSRIDALNDQWRRGMSTKEGYPDLLAPKSKKVLERVGGGAAPPARDRSIPDSPATNARGWNLMIDAKGNRAYVSPDGRQFEEVR